MKLIHYLYIAASLSLIVACNSNEEIVNGTKQLTDNGEIRLSAGIVEGDNATVTRARAEDSHAIHKVLTENTKIALQVSGTWTGHDPSPVTKTTTATIGTETETEPHSKHNNVIFTPTEKLYWDDYGTADEANTAGRTAGLTIYGAAINGKTDAAPTISNWTAHSWTLAADQTVANDPVSKDLLISNNVQPAPGATTSNDGTYKFDEKDSGKLLEFRHALSKITVNLLAGDGFNGTFGATEVKLLGNGGKWPYTTGTIDISTGRVTSHGGNTTVTMAQAATAADGYTVTKEALVMPGSEFYETTDLLRINADGNIYYVSSANIRAAITTEGLKTDDEFLALPGKNYVFNIRVNKTDIDVKATVADWVTVNAEEVAPKINVTVNYQNPGTAVRVNTFSFYRSLSLNDGYATGESEELKINNYYRRVSELTKDGDTWTMNPVRYWSSHNQHYQFRLVWPNTTTALKDATENPYVTGETVVQKWRPHVEDKEYDGINYQVIEIWNDKYHAVDPNKTVISDDYHPYPSNLAIARPDVGENQECTNTEPGHTKTNLYTGGICATEGTINLTFRFVMSQVEVNLTTSSSAASQVELKNAKVEIVNVYKTGDVKLGNREVVQTGDKGSYTLDPVKVVDDDDTTPDVNENTVSKNKRLSAIVPQSLEGVRFKITITNTHGTPDDTSDDTQDVYYADVAPIKEYDTEHSVVTDKLVAPNGKWESGYHYVYNLNVSKTEIKATATLANWTPVTANEEVWF